MSARRSHAPLRLTQRGKIAVGVLVAALVAGLVLVMTPSTRPRVAIPSFSDPIGALDESKVPNGWGPLVAAAAKSAGIPAPVLAAQLAAESAWNPNAVSSAGAQGLAQFTPDAWASHGRGDPFDPADAIAAQGRLMGDLMRRARASGIDDNPTRLALAGYNAGFGNVTKYGGVPPFDETQKYVDKIALTMGSYAKPLPSATLSSSGEAPRSSG